VDGIYRFSPIRTEGELTKVWAYLTAELEKLSMELLGKSLPINTLKVFAHYPDEEDFIHKIISEKGPKAAFSSNTSLYAEVDERIGGYDIKYLGIRKVDPYRLHVGCGDFEIEYFDEFKNRETGNSQFVRSIKDDMIELWHPNYDVLGYVVPML